MLSVKVTNIPVLKMVYSFAFSMVRRFLSIFYFPWCGNGNYCVDSLLYFGPFSFVTVITWPIPFVTLVPFYRDNFRVASFLYCFPIPIMSITVSTPFLTSVLSPLSQ
jgi:hypothetical protein